MRQSGDALVALEDDDEAVLEANIFNKYAAGSLKHDDICSTECASKYNIQGQNELSKALDKEMIKFDNYHQNANYGN